MKISDYLKDKWFVFGIDILTWILAAVFLALVGVELPVVMATEILFASGVLASAMYDFMRKKRYYDELADIFAGLEEKSYLCEMIEEPDFLDGQMLYKIVKTNGKYLNDVIAEQRQEMMEYKEYIEAWVHEVKTPVAVERLILENHKNELAEGLKEEVDKIEDYVEQMLYYSKSGSLESDYRIRTVSVRELCMNAVQKNAKIMVANKVRPQFGHLEEQVLTDSRWMEFILGQIIGNAVKYRDKKRDAQLAFTQSLQSNVQGKNSKRVDLSVRDNGIGIPPQDVSRVFTKGFTGDNGRMLKKSTGMGLYLCKNLCDKMGVGMEIKSKMGEWTEIHFYLPKA